MMMKYKFHKLFAVSIGAFLVMWFLTGITMLLPTSLLRQAEERSAPRVNFQEISISPAEAVANLAKALKVPSQVRWMSIRQIRDSVAYHVILTTGESHLIDARSGQIFTITPEIAEQIARDGFSSDAPTRPVVRLTHYDFAYPRGPLPVYRFEFNDESGTISHVSINDGGVQRTNRWTRLRDRIIRLHTFETFIIGNARLRRGLLLLLSLLGLAAVATGYYLALPQRRRPAPARR